MYSFSQGNILILFRDSFCFGHRSRWKDFCWEPCNESIFTSRALREFFFRVLKKYCKIDFMKSRTPWYISGSARGSHKKLATKGKKCTLEKVGHAAVKVVFTGASLPPSDRRRPPDVCLTKQSFNCQQVLRNGSIFSCCVSTCSGSSPVGKSRGLRASLELRASQPFQC